MPDPRVEKAQSLYWRIEQLRRLGLESAAAPLLVRMARLHVERARELVSGNDPDGWSDYYAAITAEIEAGDRLNALALVEEGRAAAGRLREGAENILGELDTLETLAFETEALPSLRDLARPLPAIPRDLAA